MRAIDAHGAVAGRKRQPQPVAERARRGPLPPPFRARKCAQASPKPTMPGTFSVPERRPNFVAAALDLRRQPHARARTYRAPTPLGP